MESLRKIIIVLAPVPQLNKELSCSFVHSSFVFSLHQYTQGKRIFQHIFIFLFVFKPERSYIFSKRLLKNKTRTLNKKTQTRLFVFFVNFFIYHLIFLERLILFHHFHYNTILIHLIISEQFILF